MIKQLIANGKYSYDDFHLYIKQRNPSIPTKRKIMKTIPAMHGAYDFSNIYGEIIYESRTIEYVFDVTGWNVEDLDRERRKVFDWLINIQDTKIIDEYNEDYYWLGSYSEGSWSEDAEQGTLTVKFIVYPFAISRRPIEVNETLDETNKTVPKEVLIFNNSSHRVVPKIIVDGSIKIDFKGQSISLTTGEWKLDNFYLEKGENSLLITKQDSNKLTSINISYNEEVF